MEGWNYAQNCFSCTKCKSSKGLQYAQNCSATTRSRCTCRPGWYCTMDYQNPYCTSCEKYKICKVGFGVSIPGTNNSNVKCERCPDGTFSDTASFTDRCRRHTDCGSRAVVRKGNTTSDTVCEPVTSSTQGKELHTKFALTFASRMTTTLHSTSALELTGSTQSATNSVFNYSTKSPTPDTGSDFQTAAVISGVTAVLLLFFAVILLFLCTRTCKKDADKFHPKVDANGNCESVDKINLGYVRETQLTSFAVTSPEQQCLLERGEASSDYSQCSNNTETLTRTEGSSSHESISPLQSTVGFPNPSSALSEPMPLISNTDPVPLQPSVLTQSSSSSQPTSPQIISPVTTSPHVNVNITFHIGNGSCGTAPVTPTDLIQAGCKLPLGQEEESFSIPQQEYGKQSLISVQETSSYSV
ncbi:tumor necrosis factor receptor superfamily member 1B isoform X2 [Anabas testudineus]|nr:tumor necrosis factor receptor superfamily member 1B isoform X2 [Anabas testudineus]